MKISAVYKITNTVTNDFYIGSSKDVKKRWNEHKCQSKWNECPNNPMYLDMQEYGKDKFVFEVLEVVEPEELKVAEQQFIEKLKPTYNRCNAKGLNVERRKETHKKASRKYEKSEKRKKYKEEYNNQLCFYDGEAITLTALKTRFGRAGIPHPVLEAKKYLVL